MRGDWKPRGFCAALESQNRCSYEAGASYTARLTLRMERSEMRDEMRHRRQMKIGTLLTLLLVIIATGRSLGAQQKRIVIAASTVLDGRGNVLHNTRVVVEGSKIFAIDPKAGPVDYDFRRLTLLPGLIDTHVHLTWHFDENHKSVNGGEKPEIAALYTAEDAWVTLEGGITTVQSVGAAMDGPVRDRIAQGVLPGARVLTSLRQITNQSGDLDALRALVRQTKDDGADLIKLFATTGLGAGGNQSMSDEQIQATCSEAKAVGLRTLVHAIGDSGARAAVLAGCTSIEHGTFLSDQTIDLMAQRGTYFDPSVLVLHNYLDNRNGFTF